MSQLRRREFIGLLGGAERVTRCHVFTPRFVEAQPSVEVPLHDCAGDGHGRQSDATQNEADDCETLAVSHFRFFTCY